MQKTTVSQAVAIKLVGIWKFFMKRLEVVLKIDKPKFKNGPFFLIEDRDSILYSLYIFPAHTG